MICENSLKRADQLPVGTRIPSHPAIGDFCLCSEAHDGPCPDHPAEAVVSCRKCGRHIWSQESQPQHMCLDCQVL